MKKLFKILDLVHWPPIKAPEEKQESAPHSVSVDPDNVGVGRRTDNNAQEGSSRVRRTIKKG